MCCDVLCCAVQSVYAVLCNSLQIGTDLQRLRSALDYLQQLVLELSAGQPGFKQPQLLGSVFLPSKRLLAQMRFRCVGITEDLGRRGGYSAAVCVMRVLDDC
jgi:hypothetical protein